MKPRKPVTKPVFAPGHSGRSKSGVTPGGRQYDASMVTKPDGTKVFVGRVGVSRDRLLGEVRGGDQKIGKKKFRGDKPISKSFTKRAERDVMGKKLSFQTALGVASHAPGKTVTIKPAGQEKIRARIGKTPGGRSYAAVKEGKTTTISVVDTPSRSFKKHRMTHGPENSNNTALYGKESVYKTKETLTRRQRSPTRRDVERGPVKKKK